MFFQIVENSRQFNGPMNPYTLKAQEILDLANSLLGQKQEQVGFRKFRKINLKMITRTSTEKKTLRQTSFISKLINLSVLEVANGRNLYPYTISEAYFL